MQPKTIRATVPEDAHWVRTHFRNNPLAPGVLQVRRVRKEAGRGLHWETLSATFREPLAPGQNCDLVYARSVDPAVSATFMVSGKEASLVTGNLIEGPVLAEIGKTSQHHPVLTETEVRAILPMTGDFVLVRDILANNLTGTTLGRLRYEEWTEDLVSDGCSLNAVMGQEGILEGANQVAALRMLTMLRMAGQSERAPVLLKLEGAFERRLPRVSATELAGDVWVEVINVRLRGTRVGTANVRVFMLANDGAPLTIYQGSIMAGLIGMPTPTEAATA